MQALRTRRAGWSQSCWGKLDDEFLCGISTGDET